MDKEKGNVEINTECECLWHTYQFIINITLSMWHKKMFLPCLGLENDFTKFQPSSGVRNKTVNVRNKICQGWNTFLPL